MDYRNKSGNDELEGLGMTVNHMAIAINPRFSGQQTTQILNHSNPL